MTRQHPPLSAISRHALALVACALITITALPLLGLVDLANIVLLFVLAVVLVATFLGRGPAILASFVAVACFDFFFVPPRFSFTVAQAQYLITFAVMLLASLIISHLTNAYREKAQEAERRARELAMLHELAAALSGAPTVEEVATRLEAVAQRDLHADTTLFLANRPGAPDELTPLRPVTLVEGAAARSVYASGRIVERNTDLRDGVVTGLYPLDGATRRRGVLAVHFRDEAGLGSDATLLSAMATLVTTAVERIHFVEVAHASTLEAQTERLRGAILSALSHDLRTPLTVLFGLADALARRQGLDAEDQASARQLRDQSYRLHRMVDNLLDLARLRSGRIELHEDWQSVPELVGATVQAMQPWLDSARLRFDWPAEPPLLRLDAVLMERVLCNLLENAAKYSPPASPIALGARVSEDGRWLQLWVDNEGEGFPQERLDKVFEIFERGSRESTVPGTGVGLAVCRAIVVAHGGRIRAQNRAEGGARLLLDLPLAAYPQIPDEVAGS